MRVIPIQTPNHVRDILIVVLGKDSLARMEKGDPAEVKLAEVARSGKVLLQPIISLCYEDDAGMAKVVRFMNEGNLRAALKYLGRGWEFRPDLGDSDYGPQSIFKNQ